MTTSGAPLAKVFERYGDRCVYCGEEATTKDHVLPRSRGGKNRLDNLRPCCSDCNQAKANMTAVEWLGKRCPEEFRKPHFLPPTPIRTRREPLTYEPFGMIVACPSCGYIHAKPIFRCKNCDTYAC